MAWLLLLWLKPKKLAKPRPKKPPRKTLTRLTAKKLLKARKKLKLLQLLLKKLLLLLKLLQLQLKLLPLQKLPNFTLGLQEGLPSGLA